MDSEVLVLKNPPAIQERRVRSLGQEDPLEKEMATHSSIPAWETPRTEEPGGLQSIGLWRLGHDWAQNRHLHIQSEYEMHVEQPSQPPPSPRGHVKLALGLGPGEFAGPEKGHQNPPIPLQHFGGLKLSPAQPQRFGAF